MRVALWQLRHMSHMPRPHLECRCIASSDIDLICLWYSHNTYAFLVENYLKYEWSKCHSLEARHARFDGHFITLLEVARAQSCSDDFSRTFMTENEWPCRYCSNGTAVLSKVYLHVLDINLTMVKLKQIAQRLEGCASGSARSSDRGG